MNTSRIAMLCLLLLCVFPAYSQEEDVLSTQPSPETPPEIPPQTPSELKPEPIEEVEPETTPISEGSLIESTLSMDLEGSDYYELINWCRRLGLPEWGDKGELRLRLYDHYGVEPEAVEPREGDILDITNANTIRVFNEVEDGHTYIRFSGDVSLRFEDEDTGDTHTVEANLLLYNQEAKLITAQGDVVYTLTKDGEDEVFKGDSITFDLEDWSGIFFDGISSRDTTGSEGDDISLYYSGEVIKRSSGDMVSLENGVITTSDRDDPYLSIKAKNIWVLAPGEWAVFQGVFYVGRIPLFYIPGFLKHGDPFFFNPVVGATKDRGTFLQTTTYLMGMQEEEDSDSGILVDFLQLESSHQDREIRGAFLKRSDGLTPFQIKMREYAKETDSYLKLMFDFYSMLGIYFAADSELRELSYFDLTKIYLGIGITREVYNVGTRYTPFEKDESGRYVSNQEGSSFFGQPLPFRYGIDLETEFSWNSLKFNIAFPLYSDPFFKNTFNQRRETIDWSKVINAEFAPEDGEDIKQMGSHKWEFSASYRPRLSSVSPYISSLSLNKFDVSMNWNKRNLASSGITNSITSFFYPVGMTTPELELRVAGTLYKTPSRRSSSTGNSDTTTMDGLVSPWDDILDSERSDPSEDSEPSDGLLELPDYQGDITLRMPNSTYPVWLEHTLSYSLTPRLSLYSSFDSASWKFKDDITYDVNYRTLKTKDSLDIDYSLTLLDGVIVLKNEISGIFNFQKRLDRGDTITDTTWERYIAEDEKATYLRVLDDATVSIFPFRFLPSFKKTRIAYQTEFYIYRDEYDKAQNLRVEEWIDWSEDNVKKHSLVLDARYTVLDKDQYINVEAVIPPLKQSYTMKGGGAVGPVEASFSFARREVEEGGETNWKWDPLVADAKIKLGDYLSATQAVRYGLEESSWLDSTSKINLSFLDSNIEMDGSFKYDFEGERAESLTTSLKLWFFSLDYVMKDSPGYRYDLNLGWIREGEEAFRPSNLKSRISVDYTSPRFWHNRAKWSVRVDSSWNLDLQRFTESPFLFDLTFSLTIYRFIEINLSSKSENRMVFRYFPDWAQTVGVERLDPITDLLNSFNFFDDEARRRSNFNLRSLSFSVTHDLSDWELFIEYKGSPTTETNPDGYQEYRWKSTFSIYVQWRAENNLKSSFSIDDGEFKF